MMVNAILFDLSNTLIDFTNFKEKVTYAAAKAMVSHIKNSRMNLG